MRARHTKENDKRFCQGSRTRKEKENQYVNKGQKENFIEIKDVKEMQSHMMLTGHGEDSLKRMVMEGLVKIGTSDLRLGVIGEPAVGIAFHGTSRQRILR